MKHSVIERKTKSGVKVLQIKIKDYPISVVSAWFNAGSFSDPIGKEGLAHFFEHLFMIKTKKNPNRISRLKKMENLGIEFNAFTGKDIVQYYFTQQNKNFFKALDLCIDGLNNSYIDDKDVDEEKGVILNERINNINDPYLYLSMLRDDVLWGSEDLKKEFFGSEQSIRSINSDDMLRFKNNLYTMDNLCFVVVSNEKTSKIVGRINQNLSLNKKSKKQNSLLNKNINKNLVIIEKNLPQTYLNLNFKTVPINDNDSLVLNIIREYLSNNWTSTLTKKLRLENKYTYWVYGDTEYFKDSGYLSLVYSTDNKNILETLKIVSSEIKKIKNLEFNKTDLDIIKNKYISWIEKRQIDPNSILWWYGPHAILGSKTIIPQEYIKKVKNITPKMLSKVAKKYLIKEHSSLILLGNSLNSLKSSILETFQKNLD